MVTTGLRAAVVRLIAGRPALDLVNTVWWRGDATRREDRLVSPDDALTWCRLTGIVSVPEANSLSELVRAEPRSGEDLLTGLVQFRSAVEASLFAAAEPDLTLIGPVLAEAVAHSRLVPVGDHHAWSVTDLEVDTPRRRLALDLLDLLTRPHGRLGSCADPGCRWVFLDTSRRQNRRWCSSADCGNRHRVRRHYDQHAGRVKGPSAD